MNRKWSIALALVCLCSVAVVIGVVSVARAKPPIGCPDVWNPVICSNGQIYSNGCYASQAGATACVPYGDD